MIEDLRGLTGGFAGNHHIEVMEIEVLGDPEVIVADAPWTSRTLADSSLLRISVRDFDGRSHRACVARVVWCGGARDGRYWIGLQRLES